MTLEEAIKHAEEKVKCGGKCGEEHAQLAMWLKELQKLRAVETEKRTEERTKTHACDSISRRKAFEYFVTLWECIGTIMDRDEWEDVCMTTANEIPSAQPEIIRCKDCKWVEHYGIDGNASYWCKNWDGGTDADGFCYEAERRTDENNNE